jgi:hypothetical protein
MWTPLAALGIIDGYAVPGHRFAKDSHLMPALSSLNPQQRKGLTGFLVGLSFGLIFAAISPNIWWAGIIGGIVLGLVVGKLFSLDEGRDEQMQRISRSPLADPREITGLAIPSDDPDAPAR